jgi:signal transduction histidine kinase
MNTYFLVASRDMIFREKRTLVENNATLIAEYLGETMSALSDDEEVHRVMEHLGITRVSHIVITDTEGGALYDPAGSYLQPGFPGDDIRKALQGTDIFYARFYEGSFFSSAIMPVVNRGMMIGAVYVHDEDPEQGAILIEMQRNMRNISVIIAIFSIVTVVLIIWSVMRRVTSIVNAIKSVREGQYSYRISMRGSDELALLGDEFNSLTDRLRETDEIRRRFVADASHELKTPLASIRLLSDSILQTEGMQRETIQEFISDIGQEAERLARTTGKLMTLTKLDSDVSDEKTRVDMRDAVNATLRMLRPLAVNLGLTLESDLREGCFVLATEDSVHQVVFNLIENAIKYNKPNGSVYVRLGVDDGKTVMLTVDDRGVGVPAEDIPHIFDRFYRVDKARSREAGGSGLGLSIVWDTVHELSGKVTAARRVGGGMRFQVKFALYNEE